MRLSVIIPVHNGDCYLHRCLSGLSASIRSADELIVLDDTSTDCSSLIAAAHGARVLALTGGPHGPACARNRGAAVATGDILVFIDADVVVHVDTLSLIESAFTQEPSVRAIFGSYDDCPPARGVASRYKNLLHHYVHQHGNRLASTFWTGCGAIRRSTFQSAGGFAENYRNMEDVEFGLRLHRANVAIRLCPEIQVTHLKELTLTNLWHTDVFARAVPWTRLILREGTLSADLNLSWRNRVSAGATWIAILSLLASFGLSFCSGVALANWSMLGAVLSLAISTALNAELWLFFFRHGGLSFSIGAWLLHLIYLLYSSAIFSALFIGQALRHVVVRCQATKWSTPRKSPLVVHE